MTIGAFDAFDDSPRNVYKITVGDGQRVSCHTYYSVPWRDRIKVVFTGKVWYSVPGDWNRWRDLLNRIDSRKRLTDMRQKPSEIAAKIAEARRLLQEVMEELS